MLRWHSTQAQACVILGFAEAVTVSAPQAHAGAEDPLDHRVVHLAGYPVAFLEDQQLRAVVLGAHALQCRRGEVGGRGLHAAVADATHEQLHLHEVVVEREVGVEREERLDPQHRPGGARAVEAGRAEIQVVAEARARGLGLLVTIPIQGWVARDASGNVDPGRPRAEHFARNEPRRGAPFTLAPEPDAAVVYQDEFANFCAQRWGTGGAPIAFSLDNEPDLWAHTHAEIQREPITYAALLRRSLDAAAAIKDAEPTSLVFGPASYGWNGFVNLQNAPDAQLALALQASRNCRQCGAPVAAIRSRAKASSCSYSPPESSPRRRRNRRYRRYVFITSVSQ